VDKREEPSISSYFTQYDDEDENCLGIFLGLPIFGPLYGTFNCRATCAVDIPGFLKLYMRLRLQISHDCLQTEIS
jgi:hypothetical protein